MPTPMEMGYKMVADRHAQFVKDWPNALINTQIVEYKIRKDGTGFVMVRCQIWKNKAEYKSGGSYSLPDGIGHSAMMIPGTTSFTKGSEVENAETSAVGRALAMLGYHPKDSFASTDEIEMKSGKTYVMGSVVLDESTTTVPDSLSIISERAKIMAYGKKVFGSAEATKKFLKDEFKINKSTDITSMDQVKAIKKLIAIHEATAKAAPPDGVVFDE